MWLINILNITAIIAIIKNVPIHFSLSLIFERSIVFFLKTKYTINDKESNILIIKTTATLAILAWNEFIIFKEMNNEINVNNNVIMNFLGPTKNIPTNGHAIIATDIKIIIDITPLPFYIELYIF